MKIIGYGICGPGEAGRYMRETLREFSLICDEVIICVNGGPEYVHAEVDLIKEFGFKWHRDTREWGKVQWKIKQDFLDNVVSKVAKEGDMMVCLDMDETLDPALSREWIISAPLDAYHVFVVDLWNDRLHYKPESCFWNVRMWRWNGVTKFKEKPVHCGLAPEWAYHYHRFAPFLLFHKGLMNPYDRKRKLERYKRYDPDAKHLDRKYYRMLEDDTCVPLDARALHDTIAVEVETYKQTKPRTMSHLPAKGRYAYVRTPAGVTIDIPERHLAQTLARKDPRGGSFQFIGWADDAQKEMEELFGDVEVSAEDAQLQRGSYQRSMASERAEVKALEAKDEPGFVGTTTVTEVSNPLKKPRGKRK